MNRFYEAIHDINSDESSRPLDLYIGDYKLPTEIGCFEAFFVINNDDQIKKMECNFLLDCPPCDLMNYLAHPSLVYIDLPVNLLNKTEPYYYKMYVTKEKCIDDISRFTKNLNGKADTVTVYPDIHEFSEEFKKMQQEIQHYNKKRINCDQVYETLDLPAIAKFRCRNLCQSFGKVQGFKHQAWYCSFHTTVPNILQHIIYNNIRNCHIEQLQTGGSGDNIKPIQQL